jgi:competence protein ComEC
MKNKINYVILLALAAVFAYFFYQIAVGVQPLEIIFLDISQGDSILIQKGTKQVLIDGGPSGKTELAELGKYLPYFDREIDIVVATHPDRDHIGGLVDVARNYSIGAVFTTGAEKDTAIFREWKDVLDFNETEVFEALKGDEIEFGGAKLRIVFPVGRVDPNAGDANNKSIVARLDSGQSSFLFTGDIETAAEREMLADGENIDVGVLKIAHHGSKSSSSSEFIEATSPAEAIISVGANNSYGHPAVVTLQNLEEHGIKVYRTDEDGDIVYECKDQSSKCEVFNQN